MSVPTLEDQLFGLPPRAKLALGLVLLAGGAAGAVALWEHGWISGATIFAAMMGAMLAWNARSELERKREIDAEVRRATAEWDALRHAVDDASGQGRSVARMLQERGYREFPVRRWIQQELGGGEPSGSR